ERRDRRRARDLAGHRQDPRPRDPAQARPPRPRPGRRAGLRVGARAAGCRRRGPHAVARVRPVARMATSIGAALIASVARSVVPALNRPWLGAPEATQAPAPRKTTDIVAVAAIASQVW